MKKQTNDTKQLEGAFPPPPVEGSKFLVPITTWPEMFRETTCTGVIFDEFWYDSVEAGVAYFFRWLGEPRATVLVVWNDKMPTHIECRKRGALPTVADESERIIAEVTLLFRNAGFWCNHINH
ncbi:MAG: hypothetical protein NTY86_01180, partial [Deltaproteobacteria bacterium]|nr:hypothetical protein [Deltaproteobacteria bacterium]